MTSLRATSEAILRIARARYVCSARDQKNELLDTSLDWQEVLSLALRHGIVPLLQVNFGDALRRMEPAVAAELRKCFQESAANSIRAGTELCRLFR